MKRKHNKGKEIKRVAKILGDIKRAVANAEEVEDCKLIVVNKMTMKEFNTRNDFELEVHDDDLLSAPLSGWVEIEMKIRYKRWV